MGRTGQRLTPTAVAAAAADADARRC